jgi:hypothetical protein
MITEHLLHAVPPPQSLALVVRVSIDVQARLGEDLTRNVDPPAVSAASCPP